MSKRIRNEGAAKAKLVRLTHETGRLHAMAWSNQCGWQVYPALEQPLRYGERRSTGV